MKKYSIIYADPPWSFGDKIRSSKKKRNGDMIFRDLDIQYGSMSTENICKIPIIEMTNTNAVLFMWTTDAHIPDALQVMKSWGFTYRTIGFIWNKKTSTGKQVCFMGKWTMKGSEICLLGTKGNAHKLLKVNNVRQLVESKRGSHSGKPIEVRKRIVEMFGDEVAKLELFARSREGFFPDYEYEGWDVYGNQVNNSIQI